MNYSNEIKRTVLEWQCLECRGSLETRVVELLLTGCNTNESWQKGKIVRVGWIESIELNSGTVQNLCNSK